MAGASGVDGRARYSLRLILFGVAVVGCSSTETTSRSTTADSAGVQIVTNGAPSSFPEWRLDSVPLMSIGGLDTGEASLAYVLGAVQTRAGLVIVVEGRAPRVLGFDSTGAFRQVLARNGGGPGEVQYPHAPKRMRDSVALIDFSQTRILIFDEHGVLASTRRVDSAASLNASILSLLPSGGFVASMGFAKVVEGAVSTGTLVARLDANGVVRDTIVAPWIGKMHVINHGNSQSIAPVMWAPVLLAASNDDRVVIAAPNDRPRLDVFDFEGRLARSIRWLAAADPVTEADKHAGYAAESTAMMSAGPMASRMSRQVIEGIRRNRQYAEHMPYFTGLLIADDGDIWVERNPRHWEPEREYLVFDASGIARGRLNLSSRMSPLQIGGDFVLAMWRDDDDVPHLRRYRLIKSRSQEGTR